VAGMVYVWCGHDLDLQHTTANPADDTVRTWEGVTVCGLSGELRWIAPEHVDRARACAACVGATGQTPPLAGQEISTP
jgi:hypothetical protein